jgi:hypothetical protein
VLVGVGSGIAASWQDRRSGWLDVHALNIIPFTTVDNHALSC